MVADCTDEDELHQTIGKRIREARQGRHMSLEQLGGELLSRSFLSQVERGRSRISLRALGIVASRLELPLSYFIDGPVPIDTVGEIKAGEQTWTVHVRQPAPGHVSIDLIPM
jgi:transcriptional regulator with XRE-family HTH domain